MAKKNKKYTDQDIHWIMQITKDLVHTELKTGYINIENIKQDLLETLEYVIDNYHRCED